MKRRWLLLLALGVPAVIAAALWFVLHMPGLQRGLFARAADELEARTGLKVSAARVSWRLLPAHLEIEGLRVAGRDSDLAALERLEARWRWRELLADPPRIEQVTLTDVALDFAQMPDLPAASDEPAAPLDPWRVLEVGALELRGGSAAGDGPQLRWRLAGIELAGSLTPQAAILAASAERLEVAHERRALLLGPIRMSAVADPVDGLRLESLRASGHEMALELEGRAAIDGSLGGELAGRLQLDPMAVAAWWDPELLPAGLLNGRLDLTVNARMDGVDQITFEIEHRGAPLEFAGLRIERLAASGGLAEVRSELGGADWGAASATWRPDGTVAANLSLLGMHPAAVLDALGLPWPDNLDRELEVSGRLAASGPLPPDLGSLSGEADLTMLAPGASGSLRASAAAGDVVVEQLELVVGGSSLRGSGRGDMAGRLAGRLAIEAPDLALLAKALDGWLPEEVTRLEVGGALSAAVEMEGALAAPRIEVEAVWSEPRAAGVGAERLEMAAQGDARRLDWRTRLVALEGMEASASGATELTGFATSASWSIAIPELDRMAALELPMELPPLKGGLRSSGDLEWRPDGWRVSGRVDASDIAWQEWQVASTALVFTADPETVHVLDLEIEFAGGRIAGAAELPTADRNGPLVVDLAWLGLELGRLPLELPAQAAGTVAGGLRVAGTLADPYGEAEVEWAAADPGSQPVDRLRLLLSLDRGVATVASEGLVTDIGVVDLRVRAPLGDLPMPGWLMSEAPGGPVRASLRVDRLSSDRVAAALGMGSLLVAARGDLLLELEWHPPELGGLLGELRLDSLEVTSEFESFTASGPLVVELRPGMLTVPSFVLTAPRSRIELGGVYDMVSGEIDAALQAELSPEAARLLPMPAGARGALKVGLELTGQASAPDGRLVVDHRGGTLTMRNPALEITDLLIEARVDGGVVTVDRGSAGVNRGRVELGGGWDPASGQGLVAEFDDVVLLLPGGILTAWHGQLAIEPSPGRLAQVVGELVLESGLWDSPVSLTSTFLGPSGLDLGTEEVLYDIGLDLQVRGRRGVRVDNNLGQLDVSWSTLHVTGTAAEPIVRGDITIAPGGQITVAGQVVTVRRGTIRMTGDPATDPHIEIVPERDLASFEAGAAGEGGGIDTQLLATRGLAQSVGSALGFENESLQPAEISVDTEAASASSFSIGQRLTSNIALLLTTDLAETARRTTMIQLWNFDRLPGLALQLYESTQEEGNGANLIQRFRWGGSAPASDRPTIHRVKLEGEWPISARRARKATGLSRGQPYDPFLLFAARVRLERELAGEGYHLAQVEGRTQGSERSPTLVFSCDPGPFTVVRFVGDVPPRRVRREVTALYQPPPLARPAMAAMRSALLRHAWSKGFAAAEVEVERRGDEVVARTVLHSRAEFVGPFLHGFPAETEHAVRRILATPTELAAALEQPERLERAVQRVLRARGWDDARLRGVTGSRGDTGEVEVHVHVSSGPRRTLSGLRLVGEDPLGLLGGDHFEMNPGDPLDRLALEQRLSSVRFNYVEAGYADVRLESRVTPAPDGGWFVELLLSPGPKRRVAEIRVIGLRHLSEKVVRHGLSLEPGDVLRPSEVDRSVVAIGSFAPVERVNVQTFPVGPDRDVLEIEVTEKPRWTVEAGGGWSSERGAELRVGVRDDNLFRRGFGLNLRARWQESEQLGLLIASLPPRPGSRWRFGATLRYYDGPDPANPDEFMQRQYSASPEATYRRSESDTLRAYYTLRETTNSFICEDPEDPFCDEFQNVTVESILGTGFVRDRMDNLFDPRRGYTMSLDVSSNLPRVGSDLSDTRLVAAAGLALEPRSGWTWAHGLQLGWVEAQGGFQVAPTRKFFAGGQGSIRGFDRDSVVPVDETLVSRGGGALLVLNQELRIPVWGPVRVAVFADIGQVWESWSDADLELAVGAGLGVRISTPIGPIWGDVAWPVANVTPLTSRSAKFYLGIGRPF